MQVVRGYLVYTNHNALSLKPLKKPKGLLLHHDTSENHAFSPREIVGELDRYIVGQNEAAKRAVAIALRNCWRRQQLNDDMRQEVTPKNILIRSDPRGQDRNCPPFGRVGERTFTSVEQPNSPKLATLVVTLKASSGTLSKLPSVKPRKTKRR